MLEAVHIFSNLQSLVKTMRPLSIVQGMYMVAAGNLYIYCVQRASFGISMDMLSPPCTDSGACTPDYCFNYCGLSQLSVYGGLSQLATMTTSVGLLTPFLRLSDHVTCFSCQQLNLQVSLTTS